ncbi:MAG: hypothetical protein UY31_C0041G0010 [Candidatus Wolfebacteria bacterium GW2011_GWE1_48_7]|nr:MAG: hypothetical protein UY31_C0041G0010 [Candidatus Wolfebacteria bacterium GW2011_GWE1_48_7]
MWFRLIYEVLNVHPYLLYIPLFYIFVNMYRIAHTVYTFPIVSHAGVAKLVDAPSQTSYAPMAKLVDAPVLGTGSARIRGSSPLGGTFVFLGLRPALRKHTNSPLYQ